jgi:hypothetical protein
MLAHFKDYTDIVGDHPLNLVSTTLALNAYMLTGEEKYKRWLLEYVDAWRERMIANGNIIPTNIGLDGSIGGACDGKWYGGAYGWSFTVVVPQTGQLAHRNLHHTGFLGFMNAYTLTGDDRYLDAWRKQADAVNAKAKEIDGRVMYPRMCGDQGWYAYGPSKYRQNAAEIYYLSMKPEDRMRAGGGAWIQYLEGKNPAYPEQALRSDFARIRSCVAGMRSDPTTPDTRLSDDPMVYNPASVDSLIQLMLGGINPGRWASILQCRLRYFDPLARRAGVPEDVAALVEKMSADEVVVTLVNTSQLDTRTVVLQAGGYAEHQFVSVSADGRAVPINQPCFSVRLAPGAGGQLAIKMRRYHNQPTLMHPWDRKWK